MSTFMNTIRRAISGKLKTQALRADLAHPQIGGTDTGRKMRQMADTLWAPPSVYHDEKFIEAFAWMERDFPLLSRERVFKEQNEQLALNMLRALDAYYKEDHGEMLSLIFPEFDSDYERFLKPFAQSKGLAASRLSMSQIQEMMGDINEPLDNFSELCGDQPDLSPNGWLIAYTVAKKGDTRHVSDPEQMRVAEDNFREFMIGNQIIDSAWTMLLSKTRFSFDGRITKDHTQEDILRIHSEIRGGEDLLMPMYKHTFVEIVEIGKQAEAFRAAMDVLGEIPHHGRMGIPEAKSIEILNMMPDVLLPKAAGQRSLLAAFNTHGDYARSGSLLNRMLDLTYDSPSPS